MICSPCDAADARRLEPDVLDGARDLIDADRVADVERLVEHDRQRGEQIAEDVLHRERDGDAADAEAGDQRRDLDREHRLERGDDDENPQERPSRRRPSR